jgi:hypothetical protein
MQKHFAARGVEEFSLDAAMAWVDDTCGFFDKEQACTLNSLTGRRLRSAQWELALNSMTEIATHRASSSTAARSTELKSAGEQSNHTEIDAGSPREWACQS